MSTRNIKDAKDLNTGELIYFKGHAQATFMNDGSTVEEAVSIKYNIPVENTTLSNIVLSPNKYYKWINNPIAITITLASPSDTSVLNNYMFEFTTGSSACTLSLPDSIKWINGISPIIETNKTYQISIINNLAAVAKFE